MQSLQQPPREGETGEIQSLDFKVSPEEYRMHQAV